MRLFPNDFHKNI